MADPVTEATAVIDAAASRKYEEAHAQFDAALSSQIPTEALAKHFDEVLSALGQLKSKETATTSSMRYTAVTVPLHFDKGDMIAHVTVDDQGKVAAFYLLPAARK